MPTIDIYTTSTCGFCKALKQFLKEQNIEYTEHEIMSDDQALQDMQSLSDGGTQVPFIVFNKGQSDQRTQTGFDVDKIKGTLNI